MERPIDKRFNEPVDRRGENEERESMQRLCTTGKITDEIPM